MGAPARRCSWRSVERGRQAGCTALRKLQEDAVGEPDGTGRARAGYRKGIRKRGRGGIHGSQRTKRIGMPDWYQFDDSTLIYPAVMSPGLGGGVPRQRYPEREPIRPRRSPAGAGGHGASGFPPFGLSLHRGAVLVLSGHSMSGSAPGGAGCAEPLQEDRQEEKTTATVSGCGITGSRIAVELFHSIADGTGAMIFLKTLAARYLQLRGLPGGGGGRGCSDCDAAPRPEEMEDSHTANTPGSGISKAVGNGRGLPSQR